MTDIGMILQRAGDAADLFADRDFLEAVARAANREQARVLAELLATTGRDDDADRLLAAHEAASTVGLPNSARFGTKVPGRTSTT